MRHTAVAPSDAKSPPPSTPAVGTAGTKMEKWVVDAWTWVASATVLSSVVNAFEPAGAVRIPTVVPTGTRSGEKASLTSTG
jgi:hypothetical protein